MASHRKSIIKASMDRLESKMAIGQSRREAKQQIREQLGPAWSVSDGKIHSFKTRSVYQEQVLRFVSWARDTYSVPATGRLRADDCDPAAARLVTQALGRNRLDVLLRHYLRQAFFKHRQWLCIEESVNHYQCYGANHLTPSRAPPWHPHRREC